MTRSTTQIFSKVRTWHCLAHFARLLVLPILSPRRLALRPPSRLARLRLSPTFAHLVRLPPCASSPSHPPSLTSWPRHLGSHASISPTSPAYRLPHPRHLRVVRPHRLTHPRPPRCRLSCGRRDPPYSICVLYSARMAPVG